MTAMAAIMALYDIVGAARAVGDTTEVTLPIAVADAIIGIIADPPIAEADYLWITLGALDARDCTERMLRIRGTLQSALRANPEDGGLQARARDLIATARLRQRLRDAIGDALAQGHVETARACRLMRVAADMEIPGWQHEALDALERVALTQDERITPMTIEQATYRLMTALRARAAHGLPCTATLAELHREYGAPQPALSGRVFADPILGPALQSGLAGDGLDVTWHREARTVALAEKEGDGSRKSWMSASQRSDDTHAPTERTTDSQPTPDDTGPENGSHS